ncbi:hypothetical protein WDU94_004238 [Cyamophila willieti]
MLYHGSIDHYFPSSLPYDFPPLPQSPYLKVNTRVGIIAQRVNVIPGVHQSGLTHLTRTMSPLESKYGPSSEIQCVKAGNFGSGGWSFEFHSRGHVARMDERRTTKTVLTEEVEGRRSRGRPKLRWSDYVKADVEEMGLDAERWMERAQDRSGWRESVEQTYGQLGPGHE